ncbi:MAG: ATP-binding cassette domain-containing protein [Gammaproteobacteria bacterium]|nr:ATP-binding cassette domain-containing protein [Gammaproteobacteria bacterium]
MSLLRAQSLKKHFGDTRAVDGVDFVVNEGELLSLVGTNGAGKTTLVNLVTAYLQPDDGRIFLGEHDITFLSVAELIRTGIARSFQIVNLFDDLTVLDNVALAIFSRERKTRNLFSLAERDAAVSKEAHEVLRQFGVDDKAQALARDVAQGERKLLDVAIAFALRPRLLFLDEPTSGVSTREKAQIMDTIASVVRAEGITAVIIEHDMDVVFKYSERIVVMHEGRFLADGPAEAIRQNQEVATYLLGAPPAG